MPSAVLRSPAGYLTSVAVAFTNTDGNADQVSAANPLPVSLAPSAADAALAGTAATSVVVGPFHPSAGRAVMLSLAGAWTGTVRLQRSTDGGATRLGLTAMGAAYGEYTANICEPVWEESETAALLYLNITLASGAVTYRMGQ
jgi:hypothetical protein